MLQREVPDSLPVLPLGWLWSTQWRGGGLQYADSCSERQPSWAQSCSKLLLRMKAGAELQGPFVYKEGSSAFLVIAKIRFGSCYGSSCMKHKSWWAYRRDGPWKQRAGSGIKVIGCSCRGARLVPQRLCTDTLQCVTPFLWDLLLFGQFGEMSPCRLQAWDWRPRNVSIRQNTWLEPAQDEITS